MLDFRFAITNPWAKDKPLIHFYHVDKKLSTNKNIEIECYKSSPYDLFKIDFDLSFRGRDHAGPSFNIEIFGYAFESKIYDRRHWNYEKGRWNTPEDLVNEIAAEYAD